MEFENIFNVYSDNKILTVRILTSDTMELIKDFYKETKIKLEIILKNEHFYIKFYTGQMFEPRNINKTLDKEELYMYYKVIKMILDITKKIDEKIEAIDR